MDELDLALLHVLQAHPRISWAEASSVLGASTSSLSTRWERMRVEGLAWVTGSPSDVHDALVAFINVHCEPGRAGAVCRLLEQDARVVTIDVMLPGTLLHVTVMTRSMGDLSELVATDLPSVPGIVKLDACMGTAVHRGGDSWRIDAIDPAQSASVAGLAHRTSQMGTGHDGDDELVALLFADGRASAADMARSTGRSPSTVRRQLGRLLATDRLALRCDVSHADAGWPISSTWWVTVPPAKNKQTVDSIASLAVVRFCASITGSANMLLNIYTRALGDLMRVERAFGDALPWLEVQDVMVNLRASKRMGWLLDEQGRATGERVLPAVFRRPAGSSDSRASRLESGR